MSDDIRNVSLKKGSEIFQIAVSYNEEAGYYKPVRDAAPAQLGKRYVCAHPLTKVEDDKTVIVNYESTPSGPVEIDGCMVSLGCGSEALCTKAAEKDSTGPYCCGMPMVVKEAKPIPSSD